MTTTQYAGMYVLNVIGIVGLVALGFRYLFDRDCLNTRSEHAIYAAGAAEFLGFVAAGTMGTLGYRPPVLPLVVWAAGTLAVMWALVIHAERVEVQAQHDVDE